MINIWTVFCHFEKGNEVFILKITDLWHTAGKTMEDEESLLFGSDSEDHNLQNKFPSFPKLSMTSTKNTAGQESRGLSYGRAEALGGSRRGKIQKVRKFLKIRRRNMIQNKTVEGYVGTTLATT